MSDSDGDSSVAGSSSDWDPELQPQVLPPAMPAPEAYQRIWKSVKSALAFLIFMNLVVLPIACPWHHTNMTHRFYPNRVQLRCNEPLHDDGDVVRICSYTATYRLPGSLYGSSQAF